MAKGRRWLKEIMNCDSIYNILSPSVNAAIKVLFEHLGKVEDFDDNLATWAEVVVAIHEVCHQVPLESTSTPLLAAEDQDEGVEDTLEITASRGDHLHPTADAHSKELGSGVVGESGTECAVVAVTEPTHAYSQGLGQREEGQPPAHVIIALQDALDSVVEGAEILNADLVQSPLISGTEVERDLSRAGLWYKPIAEIIDREGYQTMNDLRAGYHDADDVIRSGGHLLFLAWKVACKDVPLQNLAYIQESKSLWSGLLRTVQKPRRKFSAYAVS